MQNAVKKFKNFCMDKKYYYPDFSEKAVVHYIVQLDKDKAFSATINQIKPVLMLVEKLSGVQNSTFTDTVDILLTAAREEGLRLSRQQRKLDNYDDILHQLFPVCFVPNISNKKSSDPVQLITYVWDVIIYFTFCRFNY
jgi:hypothetical protein